MNKNQKALKEFLEWMMSQRIENDANSFDYDPNFVGVFVEDQLTGVQHKIKGKTVSDLYKHITKGMSKKEINEVVGEVVGLVEILDGRAYYDGDFYKDEVDKLRSKKNPRYSQKALRQGTFVESEHTSSKKMAQKIARDHLRESPYYYNDWEKKERLLKKRRVNPQKMIKRQSGKSSPRGLWDNIRAKRARGEKPRKPGAHGAPTREAFERSKKNPRHKWPKFEGTKLTQEDANVLTGEASKHGWKKCPICGHLVFTNDLPLSNNVGATIVSTIHDMNFVKLLGPLPKHQDWHPDMGIGRTILHAIRDNFDVGYDEWRDKELSVKEIAKYVGLSEDEVKWQISNELAFKLRPAAKYHLVITKDGQKVRYEES